MKSENAFQSLICCIDATKYPFVALNSWKTTIRLVQ